MGLSDTTAMGEQTIAFLGGGNMATSLIGGLIADGWAPERIYAADPDPVQRESVRSRFPVHTTDDNVAAVLASDVVVLAVKPQVLRPVAEEVAEAVRQRSALVVSIAAGAREPDIRTWLGGEAAVVRAMPNTPALVQTAATALYANSRVTGTQRDLAETLLRAVGLTLWLEDEALMDAVTALSGSGPAYFFRVMEALERAGTALGLSPEHARLLTLQTALGAAKMALESSDPPQMLRRRVTSPGGTTERALAVLDEGGLDRLFHEALGAATRRARELADEMGGA